MHADILQIINDLATPLAEERELFVVDVDMKDGGIKEVWLYLDGENRGVNLDECAKISRELGFLMEANELFTDKYRLNVSSPGLSRPLSDIRQFRKNIGRTIKIKYKKEEDYHKISGTIEQVADENLTITEEDKKKKSEHIITFDSILEAKIVPKI